ncbi:ABC transporter ATP-binding protein [Clostridium chromiireducens]|uniref:ABC transporter ATP-binding protein n=1 Tax=Clostridium chromiireducens TaxID=225345 RepID=UPI003AF85588
MESIIEISKLSKRYESKGSYVDALLDIDLEVKEGECLSIIGSSGCGKSTLLKIIAGLETEYEGTITFDGKPIEGPSREKGVIFQDHRLLPWMTVAENIRFSLPDNEKDSEDLIKENIELVGLNGFENAYPKQLSGGMAQRVSIARALANRPKILLLDEPFGALDAITRINMQEEMLRIWEKEKITMIIVTHDIDEAIYLGNRVIVMSSRPGRIRKIEETNLGSPRLRTSALFNVQKEKIYKEFFKEENVPFLYNI